MVAKDTFIGIIGALLLVGVMVGVFVYEYDNVEDPGPEPDGFGVRYPYLDPDEDIDRDGLINSEDDDLDGDNVTNEEDEDVVVSFTAQGVVGPDPGPTENSLSLGFLVGTGNNGTVAVATWDVVLEAPVMQPTFTVTLELPDGDALAVEPEVADGTATATFDIGPADVGEAVLRVSSEDSSLVQADVALEAHVTYGR